MSKSHGIMMGKEDALMFLQNDVQDGLPKSLWDSIRCLTGYEDKNNVDTAL